VALLAIALLIGNFATMSCVMANSACNDCPDHKPALCADACAKAGSLVSVQPADFKPDLYHPVLVTRSESPDVTVINRDRFSIESVNPPDPHASPPLRLQFCTFLK